jgi:VIT1/CCC1 family predicted Fe2+/Mn2+ transporter
MISDIVYGGIDGTITTFAILAGGVGNKLSTESITILGLASILSDGFSMGISSYESVVDTDKDPLLKGITTFMAFVVIGLIPILVYYCTKSTGRDTQFTLTIATTMMVLFGIGIMKGVYMYDDDSDIFVSGLKTMSLGGIAGVMAYYVSKYLSQYQYESYRLE